MKFRIAMLLLCAGAFYPVLAKNSSDLKYGSKLQESDIETYAVELTDNSKNLKQTDLIYLNENRLQKVKDLIEKQDTFFTEPYHQLR